MNELLEIFNNTDENSYTIRDKVRRKYSFAVPNNDAIQTLIKYSPLIEIGAGTGYWSYLINKAGGQCTAYDNGDWKWNQNYVKINKGGPEVLKNSKDNLFLCWPPYNDSMAADCLNNFNGKYLIYVGESYGGCTANDEFFNILKEKYTPEEVIRIPQWHGIHDCMVVYSKA